MATELSSFEIGDVVKNEAEYSRSRALLTVLSGQVISKFQPCLIDPATGKVKGVTSSGNEAHTYDMVPNASAGTYRLRLWHQAGYWVETADIAWNAAAGSDGTTSGTIRYAVAQALGVDAVTVSGTAATAIVLTWAGTGYAGKSMPLGSAYIANLTGPTSCPVTRSTPVGSSANEIQLATIAGLGAADIFRIGVPTREGGFVWTEDIAYDANAATISTAIDNALAADALVVATGTSITAGITLTYSGAGYTGKPWPPAMLSSGPTDGATLKTVVRAKNVEVIALDDYDATAGDLTGKLFLVRDAVVDSNLIAWYGVDPALGAEYLKQKGIICLSESSNLIAA